MSDVLDGRLLWFAGAACTAILVGTSVIPAPMMILIFNGLLLSVAAGVVVAYAPVALGALRTKAPSRGDFLGLGIFLCWISVLSMRVLSILARELGYTGLVNTHWVSINIGMALAGGILHLWAPNALEGRIPRQGWVQVGIVVGLGIFAVFGLWTLHHAARPFSDPIGFR